jgi:hypothetical protein
MGRRANPRRDGLSASTRETCDEVDLSRVGSGGGCLVDSGEGVPTSVLVRRGA